MLDKKRFFSDWTANVGSVMMLAVSGILINSLIAKLYGATSLGIFNQVYAILILGSQVATLGCQFSVLRFVPEFSHDTGILAQIIGSACLVVALFGAATVALIYVGFRLGGDATYGPDVTHGVILMLPGLWFFAMNKALLNALNGIQANKVYAALIGLRYLLLAVALLGAIWIEVAANALSVIFSVTETLLFLAVLGACVRIIPVCVLSIRREWVWTHVLFGSRSVLGGIAVELNTRVDVLVLGLFASNAAVGIYSFAAFFIEGVLQFAVIARRIVDPLIAQFIAGDRHGELVEMLRRGRNLGSLFSLVVYGGSAAAYPWATALLADSTIARASWPVYLVLAIGASIYGTYATFGGLFSQAGKPALQSRFNVVVLGLNAGLCFALAPVFQINGAAAATSLSFVLGTVYFRALVKRHFGVGF